MTQVQKLSTGAAGARLPALAALTPPLSAEFRLVAACCRWPASDARNATITEAARAIDWPRLLRVTKRQRVEGLVADGLRRAKIPLPPELEDWAAATGPDVARRNLAFVAESVRLRDRFAAAGVPMLFVKGVTLGKLAYDSLSVKTSWDIDLAVPPDRTAEACALLDAAGYVPADPGPELTRAQLLTWLDLSKETLWIHGGNGMALELHSRLVSNPSMLRLPSPSTAIMADVAPGVGLPTLDDDALFAYLCIHGAGHAWSRMKWIADVAAFLGSRDIERLYRRSQELGAGRCSAQALLLCAILFDTPVPAPLLDNLLGDRLTHWLVGVAFGAMAGRHEERELDESAMSTLPIQLAHFALVPGWRYKAAEVWRKSLNPRDRIAVPLPRMLHFLYPLILLPSWLLRRIKLSARAG